MIIRYVINVIMRITILAHFRKPHNRESNVKREGREDLFLRAERLRRRFVNFNSVRG